MPLHKNVKGEEKAALREVALPGWSWPVVPHAGPIRALLPGVRIDVRQSFFFFFFFPRDRYTI